MASRSTITQTVYDELVTVMSARSDVSNGDDHVVLDESNLPDTPPAVAFDVSETPQQSGAHNILVDELVTNASGGVIDIRYREDRTFSESLTVMAQTDATAVSVYEDLRQHFNGFQRARSPSELHADVDEVTVQDSSPTSADGREGHILRVDVEYGDTFLYSDVTGQQLTPTSEVEQIIEAVDGSGA